MRWMSATALLMSLVSLTISAWMWQQADARAEAALQRREKALVDKHRPAMTKVCREFGIQEPPSDCSTIDELVQPLEGLFAGLRK